MDGWRHTAVGVLPWAAASLLCTLLVLTWFARFDYPFDLEWMEGGMLGHAWRLDQGLPLYIAPSPDFIPFVYPPGYAATVAAVGSVTGLSLPVGRAVSLLGLVLATSALGFGVWRHTGRASAAVFGSAVFLGTYPASGAFFDLTRPDSLSMGLAACAVVLAAERWRGAVEASALLLAASFTCKHNLAVFGLPLAIAVWQRDGWRVAVRFAAVSAGPALVFTGYMQWVSDGHFLRYLIEVPASHPQHGNRVLPGMPQDLGNALPVALAALGSWLALRPHGPPRVSAVAVAAGIALATGCHLGGALPPGLHAAPAAIGAFGIGTGLVGLAASYRWSRPGWKWTYLAGVGLTALVICGLMRSHHGGYVNVYIPLHWSIAGAFALLLARLERDGWRTLAMGLATAQLLFATWMLEPEKLRPSFEDVERGTAFVGTLESVQGPVFSPFAAWLPAQAGHPPSLHLIALWDLDHERGPYFDERLVVKRAIEERYWGAVVEGSRRFMWPLEPAYVPRRSIAETGAALNPKTGWQVRPTRVLESR